MWLEVRLQVESILDSFRICNIFYIVVQSSWNVNEPFLAADDRVTIGEYIDDTKYQFMSMDEELDPNIALAILNFDGE